MQQLFCNGLLAAPTEVCHLRVWSARIFFNRCFVIFQNLVQGKIYPGVVEIVEFGYLFFWVYEQIVDCWISHISDRITSSSISLRSNFQLRHFTPKSSLPM